MNCRDKQTAATAAHWYSNCCMAAARLLAVATLLFLHATLGATQANCKDLLKPLVLSDNSPIFGKWVLNVAASDQPALLNMLATVKSSWVDVVASPGRVLATHYADRLTNPDRCVQGVAHGSFCDSSTHTTFNIEGQETKHEGSFYETCADCMLSKSTTLTPDGQPGGNFLFLWTRTGQLDASVVEKFKQQVACLNMNPEYHFGTVSDLCPDERAAA